MGCIGFGLGLRASGLVGVFVSGLGCPEITLLLLGVHLKRIDFLRWGLFLGLLIHGNHQVCGFGESGVQKNSGRNIGG